MSTPHLSSFTASFRAILALGLAAAPAVLAQTNPAGTTASGVAITVNGQSGTNNPASSGTNGGTIVYTNDGTLAPPAMPISPTIALSAAGGNGGSDDDDAAGNAGNGGTLTFTNNGSIVFNPANVTPAMIVLTTTGGSGGMPGDESIVPTAGGTGGAISFVNNGSILPSGRMQYVLMAAATGGISGAAPNGRSAVTGVGGKGGTVSLALNTGTLALPMAGTTNSLAYGVFAAATGGAGAPGTAAETGAFDFLSFASGGGTGGQGGNTSVTLAGAVSVPVSNAIGLFASANGGNGGLGGSDLSDIDSDPADGGKGGGGGLASLTVGATGSVSTTAASTTAVMVEVLGGNGGNGGDNHGALLPTGGKGGNGGDVGDSASQPSVVFNNYGSISTAADNSPAVILQAVGGLGGNGSPDGDSLGGGGGKGGFVNGTNAGTITTSGDYGFGLFGQSVGGTGGNGGSGSGLDIGGGGGGDAGLAGGVQLSNSGVITTLGDGASGLVAQSIGGGNANNAFAAALFNLNVVTNPAIGGGTGADGGDFPGSRGGQGGSGGDGGDVVLAQSGSISTAGSLAYGMFAQSVGGGGGNGGSASAHGLFFSVALGGGGGPGGDAGNITLNSSTTSGSITTTGLASSAINAQSVGGAGGVGGSASAASFGLVLDFSIAIGGSGGAGGDGGDLTLTNTSKLVTQSIDASGILALSIGGGGGQAGQASSTAISMGGGELPSLAFGLSLGGAGGQGGHGGDVTVTNQASISTGDAQSYAIQARSVGGGGGIGANAAASTLPLGVSTKVPSFSIATAVGGSGGSGGIGGSVTVTNSSSLLTAGRFSDAIHASSVGGGGGNGGIGSSTTTNDVFPGSSLILKPGATYAVDIGVGGSGGSGGDGGAVSVTSSSAIQTQGPDARGIFAQSVGGGGGSASGGAASGSVDGQVNLAIGGKGGTAGDGGAITLALAPGASVSTAADGSPGLHAQSVGGGGGIGGTAASGDDGSGLLDILKTNIANYFKQVGADMMSTLTREQHEPDLDNDISLAANVGIGGSGGASGHGGDISLTQQGTISTQGDVSHGVHLHSIGGGGGSGGASSTMGGNMVNANLGLGGSGGASGNGGNLTFTHTGHIVTGGDTSFGLLAQSIGGGGGQGGLASDDTNLSYALTLSIGGNGNASGAGGTITVNHSGTIQTSGAEAHGLVAQSVGGGGGLLFLNFDSDTAGGGGGTGSENVAPTLSLAIGGNSGTGGRGGDIALGLSGGVSTTGSNAFAVFAQSIGGGGGFAADGTSSREFAVVGTIGGAGGAAGDGGSVKVTVSGAPTFSTSGVGSTAVFLQSIGGGGGYSGGFEADNPLAVDGFFPALSGAGGSGGAVTVTTGAGASVTIVTTGASAHGIFAQSLGGGGGAVGTSSGLMLPNPNNGVARLGASGSGGPITITTTGTISATGAGSVGIYAQSGVQLTDGTIGSGGGAITLSHTGSLTGGSGSGAAVQLDGGATNTITLTGGTVSAASGLAILASSGNDSVINRGTLIGSVDLGSGVNSLLNDTAGTFLPGATVNLGSSGGLSNHGTLNVGGAGTVATTNLTGGFTQQASGTWQLDVDFSRPTADVLNASGPVGLSGRIAPNVLAFPTTLPASGLPALPIVSGQQVATNALSFANTLALTYSLSSGPNGSLQTAANFAPAAVLGDPATTDTLAAAANGLQGVWTQGALGALAPEFLALANVTSVSAYQAVLANYATEGAAAQGASGAQQATQFQASLHSLPAFVGDSTQLTEQGGGYVRLVDTSTRHRQAQWNTGYDQTARTVQVGGQRPFASSWFAGASFAYTDLELDADDRRFTSRGRRYDVGAVVKRLIGERWHVAASLSYGYSDHDQLREARRPAESLALWSKSESHSLAGKLRAAWHLPLERWYLRPSLDLDVARVIAPAHRETGDARYALRFDREEDLTVAATPALEAGVRGDFGRVVARAYASVGESFAADREWSRSAWLAATGGAQPFVSRYEIDASLTQFCAGLDLISAGKLDLKAEYRGQFGSGYAVNSVVARLALRF